MEGSWLISGGSTPASTAEPADRVPWDAMGPPCMTHVRSAVNFWGQMGSHTFIFVDSSEREAHPPHPCCGLRALELELRRFARPPAASLAHTWHLLGLQMPLYAPNRSRCLQA